MNRITTLHAILNLSRIRLLRGSPSLSLQRQKAEAAEAQGLKLAGHLKEEQAENAKISAKLKGTEKNITEVLGKIDVVKGMHHLLLQTLGEASDNIRTGMLADCKASSR